MDPKPEKPSLVLPIAFTLLISGVLFGGIGYYLGMGTNVTDSTLTTATPHPKSTASASPTASPSAAATTIDTSNWKTYTNSQYGFSFKYPSEDSVEVVDSTIAQEPVKVFGVSQKSNATDGFLWRISAHNSTVASLVAKLSVVDKTRFATTVTDSQKFGSQAKKIDTATLDGKVLTTTYVIQSPKDASFAYEIDGESHCTDNRCTVADTILPTFQFLK